LDNFQQLGLPSFTRTSICTLVHHDEEAMAKDITQVTYAPQVLPNGMYPHQMLSIDQFSALRGISKDTTRREIKKGNIQAKRLSARRIGIPALELFK
jgi:hypothetical protein